MAIEVQLSRSDTFNTGNNVWNIFICFVVVPSFIAKGVFLKTTRYERRIKSKKNNTYVL